jgi:hypothetical protein
MIRRAVAVAVALALSQVVVHTQDVRFLISEPSADVYKGPSTVTPVIGHVPRGTTLAVLRNLGSWVKVPWPDAPDGVAYVHVTMGRLAPAGTDGATANTSPRGSSPSASASASTQASAAAVAGGPAPSTVGGLTAPQPVSGSRPHRGPRERVVIRSQGGPAISHIFGAGAVFGSTDSFGATARAWRDNRLGVQIGFTRDAMTSDVAPGRVTAWQFEPAVVYGLYDFVSDYFWIRPYVGSGVSFLHQTLNPSTQGAAAVASDTGVGFRAFGGGEVTFAGAPRFALSVEAGYRTVPTPFPGFAPDHFGLSISGHWYFK